MEPEAKERIKKQMREYQKRPEIHERIQRWQKRYRIENPELFHVRGREYYLAHREKMIARTIGYKREARAKLFETYGGKCSCCGEADKRFLTLHHVNGDGTKARENGALKALRDAVKADDPTAYTILCFNCHLGMHSNGGVCPHKHKEGLE